MRLTGRAVAVGEAAQGAAEGGAEAALARAGIRNGRPEAPSSPEGRWAQQCAAKLSHGRSLTFCNG